MPRLIEPTIALHEAFLVAHREWGAGLHEDGFGIARGDDVISPEGFAAWIEELHGRPATSWWIADDEPIDTRGQRVLGAIALRPTEFTGELTTGHIGYGVTPSARGRGIATWALATALEHATKLGLPSCVLVCLDDNVPSIRTIERLGDALNPPSPTMRACDAAATESPSLRPTLTPPLATTHLATGRCDPASRTRSAPHHHPSWRHPVRRASPPVGALGG
ncbi:MULTISPECIES: GNAT family N-acetyltransferase [Dermacoccus]|uniref:GNAT family N-acetyltransferase n=1 Tax=Dermacoccus TaxID=57495 RepID=UPI0013F46B03|nr:GNAT family N-acetyltransferase [Dermacoccus nishinomiyaensis]